jgi:predicted membrane protein
MLPEEMWTLKELFVYPNEYIYWSAQIVMYPFMTGLVAGAFVLSSLYHLFGIKQLKEIARFSLVLSFALLMVAPLPLLLHLMQPQRNIYIFMTPHFTSAIAAFGVVLFVYASIVASEIWFLYRKYIVERSLALKQKFGKDFADSIRYLIYTVLTLGSFDITEKAIQQDRRAIRILAGVGIPVACFLHGYAGFVFGSVKANALWMTPLMPVIFIASAIVSGVALCAFTYIVAMEIKKFRVSHPKASEVQASRQKMEGIETRVVVITVRYLVVFLIFSISLELLDLVFRGYTAVKSWDILRNVIYEKDFVNIFILQYAVGNLVPFILLLMPRLTIRRATVALFLVIFGVFMMRWNVVIGGQSFSLTFSGYMSYLMPMIPRDFETYKEGLFGVLTVVALPFIFFWILSRVLPLFETTTPE